MTLIRGICIVLLVMASPATAQDAAADARIAARQLGQAGQSLVAARSARDRVGALTETVRAFEQGLTALRDGQRRAAQREDTLARQMAARDAEIGALVGTLQTMSRMPPPVLLTHPSGPLGAARAGMMLADVTPALNARAAVLRRNLEELQALRAAQTAAAATLEKGLSGVQEARAALSRAMADRTDLPRRFVSDPIRTAILLESTRTLDEFASGLAEIAIGGQIAPLETASGPLKGTLPLPVRGTILHRAGDADAAGIVRKGIVIATRPGALVTTPTAATIRYRGPLLDFGNVMILEPATDVLIVLSGLREVFGETGQVIDAGTPVGLMGMHSRDAASPGSEGAGTGRSETLYIEVRESGQPVDPATWFRIAENG